MDQFLFVGTILGAVFGALHAPLVYRNRIADEGATSLRAGYFAIWAFALWTLFGAYVLAFWLIGFSGLAVSRIKRFSGERA